MGNEHGCIYVDGSFLFASIERVKRTHPELASSKLNVAILSRALHNTFAENIGLNLRTNYYFRTKDERIASMLTVPPPHGQSGHWQIKECGINLRGMKPVPTEVLDQLPKQYRDLYPRAEKGLDMELACDALLLAASGRVQSFVFLIGDRDFMPLLTAVQRLGSNTYIAGLDVQQHVPSELLNLADRYATLEGWLNQIFAYTPQPPPVIASP
ncbi:MAG TPA: NYN domain-containing protein [Verrucomicrobiae bacterium]|nr:NYN domain-containing protein [Verrucomicrobiae bacterium]